ncbi:ATP-binding protein [Lentzea sp. NPDC004782]|uniref:ATP-binding protein n=1 Tax=Lentzea sp. NPDC004782 TaxID=3154458 RepID=UPI0033B2E7FA
MAGRYRQSQLVVGLRTLKKLLGLTNHQIAAAAKIEERRVGDWLRGDHVPERSSLQLIVRAMVRLAERASTGGRSTFPQEHAHLLDDSETGPWWGWWDSAGLDHEAEDRGAAFSPLKAHIREFGTLIEERTRRFTGRGFVLDAIEGFLDDPAFASGYVVLRGEPGIGKTTVLAELIRRHGCIHHFNIATEGIRSADAFLADVCAQLIVRYGLDHADLPAAATRDGGFLGRLLAEAAVHDDHRPVLVVVDALDEAEEALDGTNTLFLPSTLPRGVHFVVSTREQHDLRLLVEDRRDVVLRDDDPRNIADIRDHVSEVLRTGGARLAGDGVMPDKLVDILVERSEGNFMYVKHVLRDILAGVLTPSDVDTLPNGLRDYYRTHWSRMRARDAEHFLRFQEPTICLLATAREPVTVQQVTEWVREHWDANGWESMRVRQHMVLDVVRRWRGYLNTEGTGAGTRYRIYHASFQDFLCEEIGLADYHTSISASALAKIAITETRFRPA